MKRVLLACVLAIVAVGALDARQTYGAKAMFYDPGDLNAAPSPLQRGLRPIAFASPFYHCGIHYWLQSESGWPMTERVAAASTGSFRVRLRNNIGGGFLAVFDVQTGRELTPRDGGYSGFLMSSAVYTVPGDYEFTSDGWPSHLVIVWARSQTEIPNSADAALQQLKVMSGWSRNGWPNIIREVNDSTPGEIGTYVVNRFRAGVAAEVIFAR